MKARTSTTHPLRIEELRIEGIPGVIGLTFCPGKVQRGALSGDWNRDLEIDVRDIRRWGASALLNLLTLAEMLALKVGPLPQVVAAAGIAYHHLPIADGGFPDAISEAAWTYVGADLRRRLEGGERILIHCKGGLGRTGIMAARLLVEFGCDPDAAMSLVRTARPGAIENKLQEEYVCRQRCHPVQAEQRRRKAAEGEMARERFFGCLLGGAVGDALGAPVEFLSMAEIRRQFGKEGLRDYAPAYGRLGAITDDTQMTLFTAEGLIRAWVRGLTKGISSYEGVTGHAYVRWLRTQGENSRLSRKSEGENPGWLFKQKALHDRRAPGTTCLLALRKMGQAGELAKNTSKGCGGVMRVAPAGLLGWRRQDTHTPAETFDLGAELAHMTHGHPTGYLSAGVFAVLIRALAAGATLAEGLAMARRCLISHPGHAETLTALEAAEQLAASDVPSEEAIQRLGQGWVAEEALAIGVYCALVAKSFEDGVLLAVNHGGDSDSTGSIAGNLLGTKLGIHSIPEKWLSQLELRDVITELANDLYSVFDWGPEEADIPGAENALCDKYPPG